MKMRLSLAALCLAPIAAPFSSLRAQNLVPNPGFEQFTQCPNSFAQLDNAQFWFNPTPGGSPMGSADLFNACSPSVTADVPLNFAGQQQAHDGSGYAGFATFSTGIPEFREYVEVPLTAPLAAGVCYELSFFVSRGDTVRYGTCDLGALFSTTMIMQSTPGPLLFTPSLDSLGGCIGDAVGWTLVSGLYEAQGGEAYLVIGNFHDDAGTTLVNAAPSMLFLNAYYYIDDVSVVQAPPNKACFTVGVQERPAAVTLVYMDAAADQLHITLTWSPSADLVLRDANGRLVLTTRVSGSATVDLARLAGGVYVYELRLPDGGVDRGRFVKP